MFEHWVDTDLNQLPNVKRLAGRVFTADSLANKIGVRVFKDGEPYSLDFNVTGSTNREKAADAQVKYFQLGNVKLLRRPQVSTDDLVEAGWTDAGSGGTATVYTCAYEAGSQGVPFPENVIIHITPILSNGTILSPSGLDDYVDSLLSGGVTTEILGRDEFDKRLVLWVQRNITDWTTAGTVSDEYDSLVHRLQAVYYGLDTDMPTNAQMQQFVSDTTAVTANVKRPDGATIYVSGTASGNTAYAVLPSDAYTVPGMLGVFIRYRTADNEMTLGGVEGLCYQSMTSQIVGET